MEVKKLQCFRAVALIAAALCLVSCAVAPRPGIAPSADILRVGVCANRPPMVFKNDDGSYTGFEADLARELASALGKTAAFVNCDWEDLIPALLENRIDIIMSGMTATTSRSVRVSFTKTYLLSGQLGLTTNANALRIRGINTLRTTSMRVGMEQGTTGEIVTQQFLVSAKKVAYIKPARGVQDVLKGRIDIFIHDAPVVWWFASLYESQGLMALPFFITEENIAWAVRKDDNDLRAKVNTFISEWQQSGRLKAVLRRWLPNI